MGDVASWRVIGDRLGLKMDSASPSWFLATIFRGHRASFGRSLTRRGSQLMRRLYPTGGVMRSEDKEYRATIAPATSMKIRWRSIAILRHKFAPSNTRFLSEPHRPAHDLLHVADRRTGAHPAFAPLEAVEPAPSRPTSIPQPAAP